MSRSGTTTQNRDQASKKQNSIVSAEPAVATALPYDAELAAELIRNTGQLAGLGDDPRTFSTRDGSPGVDG